MSRHILAIDQGTTGSTALVMSTDGRTLGRFNREFTQHFPEPGWVEHDADEIWSSVVEAVAGTLNAASVRGTDIAAVGITNQCETTLVWERASDRPIHRGWDPGARGLITGLTRGTTKAHLARATLEGIAHQVDDLVRAMKADLGKPITRMRVDGGASANDVLMQYQSDVSDLVVERPVDLESTARGAAMLAGIGVGLFKSGEEASQMSKIKDKFSPNMPLAVRRDRLEGWSNAVARARSPGNS
jgi:glycerol kinase